MRTDIQERKNEILIWIKDNKSKSFICEKLKCKPITLNNWLVKMDIEYNGNQGGKGRVERSRKSALEYLKSTHIKSSKLRIKLIEDGIKIHQCEHCKMNEWLGVPIPLELNHIDGNHYNNKMINLELLCPNCHALTPTYRGKNKK